MASVIFFLYGLLLFSAVLMVLCINPIHSVLFFILVFFCTSLAFTLLHSDFLGLVFLMIYVGAIAVLFLFVVMMLNINRIERDHSSYILIGGIIMVLFFVQLLYLVLSHQFADLSQSNNKFIGNQFLYDYLTNNDEMSTKYVLQLLGIYIFTKYSIVLIFSGITLLISLIGSVYLTNNKDGHLMERKQYNQFERNNYLFYINVS